LDHGVPERTIEHAAGGGEQVDASAGTILPAKSSYARISKFRIWPLASMRLVAVLPALTEVRMTEVSAPIRTAPMAQATTTSMSV
jgi:hypothetical protein